MFEMSMDDEGGREGGREGGSGGSLGGNTPRGVVLTTTTVSQAGGGLHHLVRREEGGREGGRTTTRRGRKGGRKGLGWSFGVISLQGIRNHQEDQYTAIPDLSLVVEAGREKGQGGREDEEGEDEAQSFYAIFDGHCGVRAARYARELTHHYLVADPSFPSLPGVAMTNVCRRLDREVLKICERENLYCGTTAIMALIRGNTVYVGNLGDCAAVMCRKGEAFPLSLAQTPGRPDETRRIEGANGWVTTERELFVGQLHRMDLADPSIARGVEKRVIWVTIYRVCGELSVSRSIGDPDFKGFGGGKGGGGEGGGRGGGGGGVAPGVAAAAAAVVGGGGAAAGGGAGRGEEEKMEEVEKAAAATAADMEQVEEEGNGGGGGGEGMGGLGGGESDFPFLFPPGHSGLFSADLVIADPEIVQAEVEDDDTFLLLACDGFWDVMDAEEAVARGMELLEGGLTATEAAAQLGNLALRMGSSDNVTVVLVVFEHEEEEGEEEEGEEEEEEGEEEGGRR